LSWWITKSSLEIDNKFYFGHTDNTPHIGHNFKMHRFILGATKKEQMVDHIDGNTLNNQKYNLRIVTPQINSMNKKKARHNTGYKGVDFNKSAGKWRARICLDYKSIYLGSFDNPEDGYKAYCEASKKYHGEYGRID
jgi:hypothetical protein